MRTLVTTAAIVTALTFPAFAASQTSGKDQRNIKASHSSTHASKARATTARAQGPAAPIQAQPGTTGSGSMFLPGDVRTMDPAKMPSDSLKSPTGMDGGNRR